MSPAKRGFTLLEILVAAVLLSILVGLMVAVLIPTLRASTRGATRVELQQLALITLDRVLMDFDQAPPSALSQAVYSPNRTALTLQPLVGVKADGGQVYDDHLVAYYWQRQDGRLLRQRWPGDRNLSVSLPAVLDPLEVLAAASTPLPEERALANGVTLFSVEAGPGPGVRQPVLIRLSLARPTNPPETYEITRQALMRNSN